MANLKFGLGSTDVPSFTGAPGRYRDYRLAIHWLAASVRDDNRQLVAPALVQRLSGEASELFRYRDPAEFRVADGFQRFVRVLDEHYQYLPETELLEALDSFLYGVVRAPRQGATEFSAQFRTALSRLESVLSEHIHQERLGLHVTAVAQFPEAQRRHVGALEEWSQAARDARDLGDDGDELVEEALAALGPAPPAPVPPVAPVAAPFHFPQVFTGVLFLKKFNLSREQKASTIRAAGGSFSFPVLERILRSSEQVYEGHQAPSRGGHQHAYLGHDEYYAADDEYYDEAEDEEYWDTEDVFYGEDDWWDPEDYGDADDDGWEESGELDHAAASSDPAEADPGMEEALLGYLEARRKLQSVRTARGFTDPGAFPPPQRGEAPRLSEYVGTHSGPSKGRKGGKGKSKGKSSSKGGRTGKGKRRPFRKGKGKGRGKGKGQTKGTAKGFLAYAYYSFSYAFTAVGFCGMLGRPLPFHRARGRARRACVPCVRAWLRSA